MFCHCDGSVVCRRALCQSRNLLVEACYAAAVRFRPVFHDYLRMSIGAAPGLAAGHRRAMTTSIASIFHDYMRVPSRSVMLSLESIPGRPLTKYGYRLLTAGSGTTEGN